MFTDICPDPGTTDMTDRLLRSTQAAQKLGLSRSSFYERVKNSELPKAIKIGRRAVAWLESELDAYIVARIAERDGTATATRSE